MCILRSTKKTSIHLSFHQSHNVHTRTSGALRHVVLGRVTTDTRVPPVGRDVLIRVVLLEVEAELVHAHARECYERVWASELVNV